MAADFAEAVLPGALGSALAVGFVAAGAAGFWAGAVCVGSGLGCGFGANFDMNCWLTMMATKVSAKTRSSRLKSFGSWLGLLISGNYVFLKTVSSFWFLVSR